MPTTLNTLNDLCPIPGCAAPLYVNLTYLIPLDVIDTKLRRKDANSDDWELVCAEDHRLDHGGSETDGRPFYLPEVLTRLELLRHPDREDLYEALDRGWSACDNCGEYGVHGMHAGWLWSSEKGCIPSTGPNLFASRMADLAAFALAPTRKNGHVGGHGIQGQRPTLVEIDEVDELAPSKLEDLILPYDHAVPVRTTMTATMERLTAVCEDCKAEIGTVMGSTSMIKVNGAEGYLYLFEKPVEHKCPAAPHTDIQAGNVDV